MKYIQPALRWTVIIGIFLLPFIPTIVSTSMFFPYITGKNFAFRIIVEIIAGAWLALAFVDARYRPRRSWVLGMFALFVGVIALADAFGAYPFKSFWSNFERMDGWITVAHTFVYLVVAASVMHTENLWRRLIQLSLAVSVWLSGYGLLQVLGVFALGQGASSGLTSRIDSTFGNPIYLAVYMLFHVFFALLLIAQDYLRGRATVVRWLVYGTIAALDAITLFLTGTRGTMLGLLAGLIVMAGLLLVNTRSAHLRRAASVILAVIVVFIALLWINRDSSFVKSVGFLQRLSTISRTDTTIAARFLNIETAMKGVRERPLLGWGQENYALVFDKYYDSRMYNDEPWFDRVHNIIFDWLIAGGILGLAAYLGIWVAAVWVLWMRRSMAERPLHVVEKSIITGLLAGYFMHNLAVFDNVSSYILFATILSYIYHRTVSEKDTHIPIASPVRRDFLPAVAAVCAIVTILGIYTIQWRGYTQNIGLITVLASRQNTTAQVQSQMESLIALGAMGTQEVREQFTQIAMQVAGSQASAADKKSFYESAKHQLELQSAASPLDARFPLFLGSMATAFGDTVTAEQSFAKAHELSPGKQSILFQQASFAQSQGKEADALKYLEQAYTLEPRYDMARTLYAAALIKNDSMDQARALLEPIATTTTILDATIAQAAYDAEVMDQMYPLWDQFIAAHPVDSDAHIRLAGLYYHFNLKKRAIAVLEDYAKNVPSAHAQIDSVIKQIQQDGREVQ